MIFEMSLELEKTENIVTNPMEYDFGEISSISKVTNGNLTSNEEISQENKLLFNDGIDNSINIKSESHKKPYHLTDKLWSEYQIEFPWLYHSGKRFLCSFCEDAVRHVDGMVPSEWSRGSRPEDAPEQFNAYIISRRRFHRHSKSRNHLIAHNYVNQSAGHLTWQGLKWKYEWLEGDMENTRCLFCEEAYKKHKSIMIVTIWTCPDLKNQQSPTHFSLTHRLDRHEKCKNHLLAVQLQNNSEKMINSTPAPRLSLLSNTSLKSSNTNMRRDRKSAPIKSLKKADTTLPTSISKEQFRTLKLRYPWLLSNNETSFSCEICPKFDCKIIFDSDSSLSVISRRILSHGHSNAHSEASQKHSESTCVTRLQRGTVHKIDYKRLSNGMDEVEPAVISGSTPKRPINRFSCPQCNSHFVQSNSLIEHINLCDYQNKNSIRELSCPCNPQVQIYSTITKLDLHAVQEHSNEKLFSCYICSNRFKRLLMLYDHMIINHLIDWDPFETYMPESVPLLHQCLFCCNTFNSNYNLTDHYSQSKCKKYLQPSVFIEELDVNLIQKACKNIETNDSENIMKTKTHPNESLKEALKSFDHLSDEINDTCEIASSENLTKNRTNLFSQIFSEISTPIGGEESKKSKVIDKNINSITEKPDKKSLIETSKSSHEGVQLKWLPKTKSSLHLFSRNSSETSNIMKTINKEIPYQNRNVKSILATKSSKKSTLYQDRLKKLDTRNMSKKNLSPVKGAVTEPAKNKTVNDIQQKFNKKRNCRSIFSRRPEEVEEIVPKKAAQSPPKSGSRLKVFSKKKTGMKKGHSTVSNKKFTTKIIKENEIKKDIEEDISVSRSNVKKINEALRDGNEIRTEEGNSISPEKNIESVYLDKIKELSAQFSWKDTEDKNVIKKLSTESPVKEKCIENRKGLFDQRLSDIGIIVKCNDIKENLESNISSPVKETFPDKVVSSPEKSLENLLTSSDISSPKTSNDILKDILSPEKSLINKELFSPKNVEETDVEKATVDLNENYEIISLNDVRQSAILSDMNSNEIENTLLNTSEECTKEKLEFVLPDSTDNDLSDNLLAYCQGITLSELKICIEKTDLIEEQKRLKTMTEKRKRNTLSILRQNFSEHAMVPSSEKRVRIPTEKLRENANFVDTIRDRRRGPSERRTRKEELSDDKISRKDEFSEERKTRKVELPEERKSRKVELSDDRKSRKDELSDDKKSEERKKIRSLIKDKEPTKNVNLFNSARKRKLPLNIRKPTYLTSADSHDGSVKSDSKNSNISKMCNENEATKPQSEQSKFPKLSNLLIESIDTGTCSSSPDIFKGKKPIMIQSQLSPPCKQVLDEIQDEQNIPHELSFMDRMKKIRQLKKIRTEQQREQMMAVDRTVAEINEKASADAAISAKSDKIQKLLTCEQYSMNDLKNILHDECEKRKLTEVNVQESIPKPPACKQYSMADLKNILQDECKKRKLTDMDEYKSPKKTKLDSSAIDLSTIPRPEANAGHLLCEICHLTFRSLRARDKHVVEEHKGLKLFKCNVCELSLTTHLSLRKHANKHHPDSVASIMSGTEINKIKNSYFQCHFCSVQCISRTGLQNHITSVHRANQSKQKSSNEGDLPVSFPVVVVDSFVSKLKDANPASYYQECPICSEVVNNDFELAIHTIEHERENDSNVEANQFACPKCCRLFFGREGKTYLKDHYNIIHLQKPVPSCDECDTEFPSTWCYYEHKRTQRNCSKKTVDDMTLAADPYEPLNDPMRLAFVCSRCQTLVAGDSAQERFDQHQVECSLQMTDMDGGDDMDVHVEEEEEEAESLVVDDSAVTVVAVGGTLVAKDH